MLRLYYSPHDPRRFVPAIDVLQGRADLERLAGKIVIVGLTGVMQVDYQETPLGERMPGVEIHAQILENFYEGSSIMRPPWARGLEIALFVALGLMLIRAAPLWRTPATVSFALGAMLVPALAALAAFKWGRLQFDALSPALAMLALFATLLALTLGEASRERRALRREMQHEREQSARISGEMEAAGAFRSRCCRASTDSRRSEGSTSRRRWCPRARSAATSTTSSGSTAGAGSS
jgi:CHASE2 domain-containing sensor protein